MQSESLRTVTCRRCGNVFGVDASIGVSEAIGCQACHEGRNRREVELKLIAEREKEGLVNLHALEDDNPFKFGALRDVKAEL